MEILIAVIALLSLVIIAVICGRQRSAEDGSICWRKHKASLSGESRRDQENRALDRTLYCKRARERYEFIWGEHKPEELRLHILSEIHAREAVTVLMSYDSYIVRQEQDIIRILMRREAALKEKLRQQ
jgi:hypothetical protein